jgi:hypothetical protein
MRGVPPDSGLGFESGVFGVLPKALPMLAGTSYRRRTCRLLTESTLVLAGFCADLSLTLRSLSADLLRLFSTLVF